MSNFGFHFPHECAGFPVQISSGLGGLAKDMVWNHMDSLNRKSKISLLTPCWVRKGSKTTRINTTGFNTWSPCSSYDTTSTRPLPTVKCSEILAHIELLYNPRVNKVFTSLHFTSHFTSLVSGRLGLRIATVCRVNQPQNQPEQDWTLANSSE